MIRQPEIRNSMIKKMWSSPPQRSSYLSPQNRYSIDFASPSAPCRLNRCCCCRSGHKCGVVLHWNVVHLGGQFLPWICLLASVNLATPVLPYLDAQDEVERKCKGETSKEVEVAHFGCCSEQSRRAPENLGNHSEDRKLSRRLVGKVARNLGDLGEQRDRHGGPLKPLESRQGNEQQDVAGDGNNRSSQIHDGCIRPCAFGREMSRLRGEVVDNEKCYGDVLDSEEEVFAIS